MTSREISDLKRRLLDNQGVTPGGPQGAMTGFGRDAAPQTSGPMQGFSSASPDGRAVTGDQGTQTPPIQDGDTDFTDTDAGGGDIIDDTDTGLINDSDGDEPPTGDQDGENPPLPVVDGEMDVNDQDGGASPQSSNPATVLNEMLTTGSPLMERAGMMGFMAANRRGMMNSTAGAAAATGAMIDRMSPLAQQEASQRFQIGSQERAFGYQSQLSQQQFEQASQLSDQEFRQQFQMSREQYQQNLELQSRGFSQEQAMSVQESMQRMEEAAQAYGFTSGLSAQEAEQRLTELYADFEQQGLLSEQRFLESSALSDQEFQQALGVSRQQYLQELEMQERRLGSDYELALLDANTRQALLAQEQEMQESLANLDISAEERANMTASITAMHELYQENFRSIMSNPDISAADRNQLLQNATENLQSQTEMMEAIYGVDFAWPEMVFTPPTGTTTGGTPGAPTSPLSGSSISISNTDTTPGGAGEGPETTVITLSDGNEITVRGPNSLALAQQQAQDYISANGQTIGGISPA